MYTSCSLRVVYSFDFKEILGVGKRPAVHVRYTRIQLSCTLNMDYFFITIMFLHSKPFKSCCIIFNFNLHYTLLPPSITR